MACSTALDSTRYMKGNKKKQALLPSEETVLAVNPEKTRSGLDLGEREVLTRRQ